MFRLSFNLNDNFILLAIHHATPITIIIFNTLLLLLLFLILSFFCTRKQKAQLAPPVSPNRIQQFPPQHNPPLPSHPPLAPTVTTRPPLFSWGAPGPFTRPPLPCSLLPPSHPCAPRLGGCSCRNSPPCWLAGSRMAFSWRSASGCWGNPVASARAKWPASCWPSGRSSWPHFSPWPLTRKSEVLITPLVLVTNTLWSGGTNMSHFLLIEMPAGTQLSHCYNLTGHSLDMRIKLISLTYVSWCKKNWFWDIQINYRNAVLKGLKRTITK